VDAIGTSFSHGCGQGQLLGLIAENEGITLKELVALMDFVLPH